MEISLNFIRTRFDKQIDLLGIELSSLIISVLLLSIGVFFLDREIQIFVISKVTGITYLFVALLCLIPIVKSFFVSRPVNNSNEESLDLFDFNTLKSIIIELNLSSKKEYTYFFYCIKEFKFSNRTDVWLIEKFESSFNVKITHQFLSQVKNEIEDIQNSKELTRTQNKYLNLYNEVFNKFESYDI